MSGHTPERQKFPSWLALIFGPVLGGLVTWRLVIKTGTSDANAGPIIAAGLGFGLLAGVIVLVMDMRKRK